jgi:hypothetical protein
VFVIHGLRSFHQRITRSICFALSHSCAVRETHNGSTNLSKKLDDLTCQRTCSAHTLFASGSDELLNERTAKGGTKVARSGTDSATQLTCCEQVARLGARVHAACSAAQHHEIFHRRVELERALSDYLH